MSGRVLVVGACGKMGEQVRKWIARHADLSLGAALEAPGHPRIGEAIEPGVVLGSDLEAALADVDVAIDFTIPAVTMQTVRAAADAGVAYVAGTTGLAQEDKSEIAGMARRIAIVQTPNFSVSVSVLAHLAREAARLLGEGFDAEIFELHHAAKRDAPSGTALRLAEAIEEGRGRSLDDDLVLERAGEIGARRANAVGIQTLRGGDNPGEHTIYFVGSGERLELTHRSATRDHFASGAVRTAAWLIGKPPGLYPIEAVYGLR